MQKSMEARVLLDRNGPTSDRRFLQDEEPAD
jgi:hypothetical protein